MLGPEVRPQVHNLPCPQNNEQPGRSDAEPLDTVVCALVGVAQLLLALAQVVHLADDLGGELLDAAQLGLDGLELLGGLDGGPVLCVGANVDVELDGAEVDDGLVGCLKQYMSVNMVYFVGFELGVKGGGCCLEKKREEGPLS